MAESEDGGSLLGSSRKSLADTSVTSTADLSIFSGGQRSQFAYEEDVINNSNILEETSYATPTTDGNQIAEDDDDGSPG